MSDLISDKAPSAARFAWSSSTPSIFFECLKKFKIDCGHPVTYSLSVYSKSILAGQIPGEVASQYLVLGI